MVDLDADFCLVADAHVVVRRVVVATGGLLTYKGQNEKWVPKEGD